MNKKVYIIPGLGESTHASNYRDLKASFKKAGFKIIPIHIEWGLDMDMNDYVTQADKQIPDLSMDDYIFGFSFGAYIAAVLSKNKKTKGLIFCSLSPYFMDDIKNISKESKEYFGKKMMKSFKKYRFPGSNKCRAWFLVGREDWSLAIERARKSFNIWKGPKEITFVDKASHTLKHTNYVKEIKKIIKKL